MAMKLVMPKIGLNMEEGQISEWVAKEGQSVKKGDVLYVVETDKITNDVEALQDGILLKILVPQGSNVPVKKVVGILADPDEVVDLESILDEIKGSGSAGKPAKPDANEKAVGKLPNRNESNEVLATPLVKRLAAQNNINLSDIQASGPGGRIQVEDVEKAIAGKAGNFNIEGMLPGKIIPLKGIRKVVAERMSQATHNMAMVTLQTELDVTNLVLYREHMKKSSQEKEAVPSFNAILVYLIARALKEFPYMNATWTDEGIKLIDPRNIGVAVDTNEGLTVVVIKNADGKSITEIQTELTDLIQRAMINKSSPEDLSGGTFTVTNLGMYDVDGFTPIINPPEAGILGVGRFKEKESLPEGSTGSTYSAQFSLTFDHRIIDGAPAARFLQSLGTLMKQL
jgi:pyruvate dehydrogenase E2 component (dihydrolipoamide acetyltransferase)